MAPQFKSGVMLLKWFFLSLIIYLVYKMAFGPSALNKGEAERTSRIPKEEPPRRDQPGPDEEYIDYEEID
jgi:hypothetical protein